MSDRWSKFIHIRSAKFAPLPGEDEEIVNPGMYGKAVSLYVQERLSANGHAVPSFCAEDWGWWIEVKDGPVKGGICVYCGPGVNGGLEFACCLGFSGVKRWSWKTFSAVDLASQLESLFEELLATFNGDHEIEVIGITDECPVGAESEE